MNLFEQIKVSLREKSGKKLVIFSVLVFLLITAIVFFAAFKVCRNAYLRQMDEYLGEIPGILDNRANELRMRSRVYEEDILTRAELGLKLYTEQNELTDAQKLAQVRSAVSADSVSLLDGQRQLLSSTGPVSPEENFRAVLQALELRAPRLERYPAPPEEAEETRTYDGRGFVLLPVPGSTNRSLIFEFPCDTMLELYNALGDWSVVLDHMLTGKDAAAFAETGDKLVGLAGYPLEELTDDEISRLYGELEKVFQKSSRFRRSRSGNSNKLTTLLGDFYLASLMHYTQEDTDILLTVPLKKVVQNGFYVAAFISAIIGWGIVLFLIYAFRRLLRVKPGKGTGAGSGERVWRVTWPGIVLVIAVTALFSAMLLLLENRTNTTFTAVARRQNIQHEIDWRKAEEDKIRSTFKDLYRTRAQTLADFLMQRPAYQTQAGLQELSSIAGTDYLMRFDSAGQEIVSSNSYTGFSVGKNLSEKYRAVLLGYPSAVVGPAADPYTGRMQLGTAILMTDSAGQPDGFLLAVYSAGELNAELERMSYENTVNSFAVQKGQIAAAISDEDGRFIAHSDPRMIGQKAEDFLWAVEPGKNFEGLTTYNGEHVCVSANAAGGKTLLFMVPEHGNSQLKVIISCVSLAVLLILLLLYYPLASKLSAQALTEAEDKLQPFTAAGSGMRIFSDGYVFFLALFTAVVLIASLNGWWTSFDYVFSGQWSKGMHLFSLWAALFVLTITLFCAFLIRAVLKRVESRLSLRAKTITRLADSLISYAVCIFLAFFILDMFGVNTAALLASAGVITIAVGMGAQSMAADLLAGFFMMLEGSVHVGDHVNVSRVTGYVTDMGIRTTEITDEEGNVVILNNSQVTNVLNMSRKHMQAKPENDTGDSPKNGT